MSNCRKLFLLTFFILQLVFSFVSCSKDNSITLLFNKWLAVEESLNSNPEKTDLCFEDFANEFHDFLQSDIYTNIITINNSDKSNANNPVILLTNQITDGILEKDYSQIRTALFMLEQLDKEATFNANKNYIFLNSILIILCLLITIVLFVFLKKYEKKIHEAKQLGIYSKIMIKGIEKERSRVSKDIHDTVLQDLKALNLKTEIIIPDPQTKEEIKQNQEIKESLSKETELCMKKLREICNNLTPSELKNCTQDLKSFELVLKNMVTQFTENTNIPCVLKIQDNIDISSFSFTNFTDLFRIIQEALNNIEKHAEANKVSIVITSNNTEQNKKSLKVFITDDGKGFDLHSKNLYRNKHFGLSNMKERAKNISGELNIISEPGEGTEITLEVPLK